MTKPRARRLISQSLRYSSFFFNVFFLTICSTGFNPLKCLCQSICPKSELFPSFKFFYTFNVINHWYSVHHRFLPAKRATLVCLASNGHRARPLISSPSYSKVFNCKSKKNSGVTSVQCTYLKAILLYLYWNSIWGILLCILLQRER